MQSTLPSELVRTASLLLESLGTPIALSVAIKLRYNDWDGLAQVSCDPRTYLEPGRYLKDAAAISLLKKLKQLPTKTDRRLAAVEKWWQGEQACYKTNERLTRYLKAFSNAEDVDGRIGEFLSSVRKIILSWLGPTPPELVSGRFGPGATYSDRGRNITVPDKMSSAPSLTRNAIWWLPQWVGTQWGAFSAQRYGKVVYVPGNRYATVPKNALTDRSIAAEPSINVFYQLAYGREIRRRLKTRANWDLDIAQDVHRQVACESSRTREYCTLDLSNASDTVAYNLVKLLLPQRWFEALDGLRSPKTLIDKRWVVLEKFSSMGNGFTFELETLLFAAISCAAARQCGQRGILGVDVFVFGDDIIVRNELAHPLKSCLGFLGFELNDQKSFYSDEPFRESCGGDFFNGINVRPFFLKELTSGPQDIISFANGLRALTERLAQTGEDIGLGAWFSILDTLPTRVKKCRGPSALGDVVIHDERSRWGTRWRRGIRYFQALRPHKIRLVSWDLFKPEIVLACATYGTGGGLKGGVIPRDGVLSYKVGWVPYS